MRNPNGTFIGSGNPAGRKKGVPTRATVLRKELEKHTDELLKVAVGMALAGGGVALRLCLERILAPIRPTADPIKFDLTGDTLTEQAQSVLQAVADGEIDPDNGRKLLSAIADVGKIAESDEMMRRIEKLEGVTNE